MIAGDCNYIMLITDVLLLLVGWVEWLSEMLLWCWLLFGILTVWDHVVSCKLQGNQPDETVTATVGSHCHSLVLINLEESFWGHLLLCSQYCETHLNIMKWTRHCIQQTVHCCCTSKNYLYFQGRVNTFVITCSYFKCKYTVSAL